MNFFSRWKTERNRLYFEKGYGYAAIRLLRYPHVAPIALETEAENPFAQSEHLQHFDKGMLKALSDFRNLPHMKETK